MTMMTKTTTAAKPQQKTPLPNTDAHVLLLLAMMTMMMIMMMIK